MDRLLSETGEQFGISGSICSYEKLNGGLINESYRVKYLSADGKRKSYLFQKLNRKAFVDFSGVMSNISKVTSYLKKLYPNEKTLCFYNSNSGENYYEADDGSVWRIADWIESSVMKTTDDVSYIKEAGRAYGHFLKQLSGFDASTLTVTVPDFHNTKKILDRFISLAGKLSRSEVYGYEKELEYLCLNYKRFTEVQDAYASGKAPLRVVHNDTKVSNVLFSPDKKKAEAVIDLDTVMPGMAVYDFGDAVRSAAGNVCTNTASADFSTDKFNAFAEGYLSETSDILTEAEYSLLIPAAYSVSAELSARYFIDYFTGEHYFSVSSKEELLSKAVLQAKLSETILNKSGMMHFKYFTHF